MTAELQRAFQETDKQFADLMAEISEKSREWQARYRDIQESYCFLHEELMMEMEAGQEVTQ